jgi:hypothetical protein
MGPVRWGSDGDAEEVVAARTSLSGIDPELLRPPEYLK